MADKKKSNIMLKFWYFIDKNLMKIHTIIKQLVLSRRSSISNFKFFQNKLPETKFIVGDVYVQIGWSTSCDNICRLITRN